MFTTLYLSILLALSICWFLHFPDIDILLELKHIIFSSSASKQSWNCQNMANYVTSAGGALRRATEGGIFILYFAEKMGHHWNPLTLSFKPNTSYQRVSGTRGLTNHQHELPLSRLFKLTLELWNRQSMTQNCCSHYWARVSIIRRFLIVGLRIFKLGF